MENKLLQAIDQAYDNLESNEDDPTFTIEDAATYAVLDIMEITNMSSDKEKRKSYEMITEVASILNNDLKIQ